MFRACAAVLVLAMTAAGVTPVRGQAVFPRGGVPKFIVIVQVDRDRRRLEYQYAVEQPVHYQERVAVEKGGVQVEEVITRTRLVRELRQAVVPLDQLAVTDRDGQDLRDKGLGRLTPGTVVVLSQGPDGIDPAYRRLLAPEALIVAQKPGAGTNP